MKQKRSLSDALQAVAGRQQVVATAAVTRQASRRVERVDGVPEEPNSSTPARAGKRLIGGHFDRAVSRQLRELAAREDTTVQALLAEAMNMLFVARGLPEIAER
ncbi:MAG: ribbon-helix-helix domain-containing protein [Candidatus Binataceae bacterium]